MKTRTLLFAFAAIGLLATTALVGVEAKPGDGGRPDGAAASSRKEAIQEKIQDAKENYREHCADPANATVAKRCEAVKEIGKDAMKARREAVALLRAIRAHELQVGRLEVRINHLQKQLDSGNLTTENQTKIQDKITALQAREDKVVERIDALQAKLEALKAKWAEVRDHVKAVKEDAGDDTDASDSSSDAPSSSTSSSAAA